MFFFQRYFTQLKVQSSLDLDIIKIPNLFQQSVNNAVGPEAEPACSMTPLAISD
jgi:hypothetical protein